ncbi:MAG TPA: hypothetical protein VGC15_07695 [Acetobacteraceae bacterium]
MRTLPRAQPDLFVATARYAELTGTERQKAVALLQALLTEAVMTLPSEPSVAAPEAGHE